MNRVEDCLLSIMQRLNDLESRVKNDKSKSILISGNNANASTSRRIPICGDKYYIDADGSAYLKSVNVETSPGGNLYIDSEGNVYLFGTEATLDAVRFRYSAGIVYLEKRISLTGETQWKSLFDWS